MRCKIYLGNSMLLMRHRDRFDSDCRMHQQLALGMKEIGSKAVDGSISSIGGDYKKITLILKQWKGKKETRAMPNGVIDARHTNT
ncbi:MAG: hypothetical protein RLZZ158_934 [Cyanobacteriota bacterium]